MAKRLSPLLVTVTILALISCSSQLESSQAHTLLRIRTLLNYPNVLTTWNNSTDFCNIESNPYSTIVCYEGNITQIHIIGNNGGAHLLPKNFSLVSFITNLANFPNLKVLTLVNLGLWGQLPGKVDRLSSLEILNVTSNFLYGDIPQQLSSLTNLQTLILDDNMFSGRLPEWLGSFPILSVLSLKKNMFNGSLPDSLSSLQDLRVLTLSHNQFYGELPDFRSLTNLQVLDLEDNSLGPNFPKLGNKLISLILRKNKFRSSIPSEITSYYQLRTLDISSNKFLGPFPASLLSLPSISDLNIADNKFTGMLFENLSCNSELTYVDLSSNLLTGNIPNCFSSDSKGKVFEYARNCLTTRDKSQHPISFCRNEALAAGIIPRRKEEQIKSSKIVLGLSITGGIIGGVAIAGLIYVLIKRTNVDRVIKKHPTRYIAENASTGYSSKFLSDARYISQTMKLGALGLPAYRTFSLEELENATNNFDTSTFMGEGSQGQMYRGRLKDGSFVAIRCLKMKRSHSTQNLMHHIELISKLRHRHLVSSLGHCFECYLDDSSVSRMFLVFEYVPNGNLRNWISERPAKQSLTWEQRIAAAMGVAKGIQFLHMGIVPGIHSNNLKITDMLLDNNLVPKISSYNLPLLTQKSGNEVLSSGSKDSSITTRTEHVDKIDVYDFGVILLEIIVGRALRSKKEVYVLKNQLESSMIDDAGGRKVVDSAIEKTCSEESLKTMMEICIRCLHKDPADRPSVEDVLWNLQFAAQTQEGDTPNSGGSPISAFGSPNLHITMI